MRYFIAMFIVFYFSNSAYSENYVYIGECNNFIENTNSVGQCYYDKDTLSYPFLKKTLFVYRPDKSYIKVWIKQEIDGNLLMLLFNYSCKERTASLHDCKIDGNNCKYSDKGGLSNYYAAIAVIGEKNIVPGTFHEKALKLFCK